MPTVLLACLPHLVNDLAGPDRGFIQQLAHRVPACPAGHCRDDRREGCQPAVPLCGELHAGGALAICMGRNSDVCGREQPSVGCVAVPCTGKAVCSGLRVPMLPCCVQQRLRSGGLIRSVL